MPRIKQAVYTSAAAAAAHLMLLSDQHLESSTKRTLVENEAMAAELAYQSAQSSRLAEANNTLRAETAEMRRELGIAHKTGEGAVIKAPEAGLSILPLLQSVTSMPLQVMWCLAGPEPNKCNTCMVATCRSSKFCLQLSSMQPILAVVACFGQ